MARAQESHVKAEEAPALGAPPPSDLLVRLESNLLYVARLVPTYPIYAPIFERLEREIMNEKAAQATSVIERAERLLR